MRMRSGSLMLVVAAVALLMVPFAAGQTNVSMSFNGNYSSTSCVGPYGCVGAGLYGGTINGVNVGQGQAVPGMICDDYFDNVTKGETWTASGISVASLNSGNIASQTLFGALIGVSGYTEVAYLANEMLTSKGLSSSQQGAISEAIWFITSGGKSGSLDWLASSYYNAAVAALKAGATLSEFANLYLYTPNPRGKNEAQEMFSLVPMPEGGAALAYLLLAGACCFGAMRFKHRQGRVGA